MRVTVPDRDRPVWPLRVMVVHNSYGSTAPSGENLSVAADVKWLRQLGVSVRTFERSSDSIPEMPLFRKASLPIRPVHAPAVLREFQLALSEFKPHLVHLHNPYPLISPRIIRVAKMCGVPVVHSIRNYRHICANGRLFRDGSPCYLCTETAFPWPAIQHKCYRSSRLQSIAMASAIYINRSLWSEVDLFIAISDFAKAMFQSYMELPESSVVVRHNFFEDPHPPDGARPPRFLFVGRLSAEKGVVELIRAWIKAEIPPPWRLAIAGTGPLADDVERAASESRNRIDWLGLLDEDDVMSEYGRARIVVVPSQTHETFGRTALEALANRCAVVATRMGALPEVITSDVGWLSPPSVDGLASTLETAAFSKHTTKGLMGRQRYLGKYSPKPATEKLIDLYQRTIGAAG